MPTYTFEHRETGEQHTEIMSIAARDQYLTDHPELFQAVVSAPMQIDSYRLSGVVKPSQTHRDRLKEIAAAHPRGKAVDTF